MSEAVETDPLRYATFNEFFTRPLRAGYAPSPPAADHIACPVDGRVSECGAIEGDSLLQAKGRHYTLGRTAGRAALGGAIRAAARSPRSISLPSTITASTCRVARAAARYGLCTGTPVQRERRHRATGTAAVRAQRAGADAVRRWTSARLQWCSWVRSMWAASPPSGPATSHRAARRVVTRIPSPEIVLAKGAELGRFNMGSTVILLFEASRAALAPRAPGGLDRAAGPVLGRALRERRGRAGSGARPRRTRLCGSAPHLLAAHAGFFAARGVLEVETPILSAAGVTDPQIEVLATRVARRAGTILSLARRRNSR